MQENKSGCFFLNTVYSVFTVVHSVHGVRNKEAIYFYTSVRILLGELFFTCLLVRHTAAYHVSKHSHYKNLAIANRSHVSCAHNTSRASIVTP